ncbi:TrkH family potassium uptake protein [Corynebacterium pseudokroppenstedtii]|uniref:TrkH family potassium uptake protein n=1 Tax=Corynebacterium pseudokroppenstedtii TaxID=2804917 RepID=UPI00307AF18C
MAKRRIGGRSLNPTQLVSIGFFGLIVIGALALMMPFSSVTHTVTDPLTATFTSTSAVSLTGLTVVDTGGHWSTTGKIIIATLIQLSGLGIMSLTSLAGMILTGRFGLRLRMNAAAEGRTLSIGDVKSTLIATLGFTALVEGAVTLMLASRFANKYGMSVDRAMGEGLFHAISSFNNAGFGLRKDNLVPYAADAWILLPLAGSIIIGGLGFPVLRELVTRLRIRVSRGWNWSNRDKRVGHLSVTSRLTLIGTAVLVLGGWLVIGVLEWNKAMSGMPIGEKILTAFFQSVTPRTAGFNSVDYGQFHPSTLFITDIFMFIGGGSAGTAGGIKISTLLVLVAAMIAEFRGETDTVIGHRKISYSVVRQAMTVFALGIMLVAVGVISLMLIENKFTGSQILFEVTSAFGTVGLTTGITPSLQGSSQIILCFIMYLGRIGPITLVTALAGQDKARRFSYPEERPFIG